MSLGTAYFYRLTDNGPVLLKTVDMGNVFQVDYNKWPEDTVYTSVDPKRNEVGFSRMRVQANEIVRNKVYQLSGGRTLVVQPDGTLQIVNLDILAVFTEFFERVTASYTDFGMSLPLVFLQKGMTGVLDALKQHIQQWEW